MSHLLVRADANAQIGTGHVMRCLALAQAWQETGRQATFVLAMEAPALVDRLAAEGMAIVPLSAQPGSAEDARQTVSLAQQRGAAWVVVDGYHFGTAYQQAIKQAGLRLLSVDDYGHASHYYADLVLNQNIYADESLYRNREPYTRLLLGTRYVLLRREFWPWRGWQRDIPAVGRKVLITLGGGDPDNVTFKVIQALQQVQVEGLEAVAVVGWSNPHYAKLESAVKDTSVPIRLAGNVTNMPELMAWADLAVSAAGSTCWELAFMGLPNLVLVLFDNQRPIAEQLSEMGVAVNLGWHENPTSSEIAWAIMQLLVVPGMRAEMVRCGQDLVDGEGVARGLMHVRGETLRLRQAREDDCRLLWEWANDPEVRAAAFSSDPIPWEEHVQWFTRKLHEPTCFLFVALDDQDTPIGQVRFDVHKGDEAEIDVSIDRSKRRSGYGALLLSKAVGEVFRVTPIRTVHAFIKPDNEGSIRAFEKANFTRLGMETVRGNVAIHHVQGRSDAQ